MNQEIASKPIERKLLRLLLGKYYFSCKRYFVWFLGGLKFAHQSDSSFSFVCFSHETPLLRQLKDVDMYLQHNKITNLKIAVPKVNEVTLYPGEVFSLWKLIGKPTQRKGYKKGMVLENGSVTEGTGGGLCQLSNLVYWLTIHTPLTVIERHRHIYDVFPDVDRTQPFGSGATCFYNYGDLMIRNDTQQIFQLNIEITDTHLRGKWTSNEQLPYIYEVYEKEHIVQSEYWGGHTRHNLLYRKKYDLSGSIIDDEFVVENHAVMMYAPFLPERSV